MKKIEILSPAGDIRSLYTAFEAGAGAVYFGVSEFNARKRAENIELKDLPSIVGEAYLREISLYLTLNTLITSDEIPTVLKLIESVMKAGLKCFIIQDYGLLNIFDRFYPEAEIHISTQVTTHLKEQIAFLSRTGISRINLARELSIDEIRDFSDFAHQEKVETEVFVHGSYCLSYSGQCYLSSFLEGLSGNRGLCAQLCRRLYRKTGSKGYYLNLKDNCASDLVSELCMSGADSLKIEGRIKGCDYVYTAVKSWREMTEEASRFCKSNYSFHMKNLSSVFNRGFTSGYAHSNISDMFSDNPSDASYKEVSEVLSYSADKKILETSSPLSDVAHKQFLLAESYEENCCKSGNDNCGDVKFPITLMLKRKDSKTGDSQFICSGRVISEISPCRYNFEIEGRLNSRIEKGNTVYTRASSLLTDSLKKIIDNPVFRKIPAVLKVRCTEGGRFKLTLEYRGKSVTAYSENRLEKGRKRTSTKEDLENQLLRFGNTPFDLQNIEFEEFDDGLFIPSSIVNKVRRKAVSMFFGTIEESRESDVLEYLNNLKNQKRFESRNIIDDNTVLNNLDSQDTLSKSADRNNCNMQVNLETSSRNTLNKQDSPDLEDSGSKYEKSKIKKAVITDIPELAAYFKGKGADEVFYDASNFCDLPDPDYIPYFPSIMSPSYAEECAYHIKEGKFRRTAVNNTALISACEDSGTEWAAGINLNIINHSAADFFSRYKGFSGFFISPEAGRKEIDSVLKKSPYSAYLPFYMRSCLMTTRQCLLGMRCGKSECGDQCFGRSCGIENLTDVKGKKITVEKRENRFTALYDSRYHFIPDAVSDFSGMNLTLVIDLRIFPEVLKYRNLNLKEQIQSKKDIYTNICQFIESGGRVKNALIKDIIKKSSEGNYSRGLS